MGKLFFYLPLHLLNTYIAWLAPRWVFKVSYAPSSESVREQEQAARNKIRLAEYKARKFLTKD